MFDCNIFGNFRTRKFTDIFPSFEEFSQEINNSGIPTNITSANLQTLYYLLYARYANSCITNMDENQFKYKLYSIIFMYGPTWEKRLEIQNTLRNLTEDELITGAKTIANRAYNDSTAPSTSTLEEIQYINEQNTNQFKKSKLDAYNLLWNLLATDVTADFIDKFKKLFLVIVEPYSPLYYVTDNNEEEEEQ